MKAALDSNLLRLCFSLLCHRLRSDWSLVQRSIVSPLDCALASSSSPLPLFNVVEGLACVFVVSTYLE